MSTPCHNCALSGKEVEKLSKQLDEMGKSLASIDKHMAYWLGNDVPGVLPTQLAEMKGKVNEHETYIQQQKGAGSVGRYLWMLIVAAVGGMIGALGKGWIK